MAPWSNFCGDRVATNERRYASQREASTASQLPNRSFSPNERTHKAADKPGDKGLFNGAGGGLKVKDLLDSNKPNRAHGGWLSIAGVLDKGRYTESFTHKTFTHRTRRGAAVNSLFVVNTVWQGGSFVPPFPWRHSSNVCLTRGPVFSSTDVG